MKSVHLNKYTANYDFHFISECLVYTDENFAEQLVYAFLNLCSLMGVTAQDGVDIVNAIILGHSAKTPLSQKLELSDFTNQVNDKERQANECCTPFANSYSPLLQRNAAIRP
jgi:hypothetical protein